MGSTPPPPGGDLLTLLLLTFLEMNELDILKALAELLAQNKDFIKEFNEFKKKPIYPQQTRIV